MQALRCEYDLLSLSEYAELSLLREFAGSSGRVPGLWAGTLRESYPGNGTDRGRRETVFSGGPGCPDGPGCDK